LIDLFFEREKRIICQDSNFAPPLFVLLNLHPCAWLFTWKKNVWNTKNSWKL